MEKLGSSSLLEANARSPVLLSPLYSFIFILHSSIKVNILSSKHCTQAKLGISVSYFVPNHISIHQPSSTIGNHHLAWRDQRISCLDMFKQLEPAS